MRSSLYLGLMIAAAAGSAGAKLPPLDEDGKLKAAETAAKAAWNEKVGLFKHCQVLDRLAANYRKSPTAASAVPVATPPCADPGPYVSPALAAASAPAGTAPVAAAGQTPAAPATAKPLEASGAHSPTVTATTPPSTKAPAAAGGNAADAKAATPPPTAGARVAQPATPLTPTKDKPVEMSEAHSPPGTAVSPPSVNATNAELTGKSKK